MINCLLLEKIFPFLIGATFLENWVSVMSSRVDYVSWLRFLVKFAQFLCNLKDLILLLQLTCFELLEPPDDASQEESIVFHSHWTLVGSVWARRLWQRDQHNHVCWLAANAGWMMGCYSFTVFFLNILLGHPCIFVVIIILHACLDLSVRNIVRNSGSFSYTIFDGNKSF